MKWKRILGICITISPVCVLAWLVGGEIGAIAVVRIGVESIAIIAVILIWAYGVYLLFRG